MATSSNPPPRTGPRLAAGLLLLGALTGCPSPAPEAIPARPNVVLVIIDTLRADRLGCYGNPRDTSPFLDRIAAQGVRFQRAYAQASWTVPSVTSILTSLYPSVHGIEPEQLGPEMPQLAPQVTTVAEILQQRRYATGAFLALPFSLGPLWGFDRGFTTFQDAVDARSRPTWITAADNVQRAREWLRSAPGPFFCLLHFFDVHYPYRVEEPYGSLFLPDDYAGPLTGQEPFPLYAARARAGAMTAEDVAFSLAGYDGAIRSVDAALETFWTALEEAGIAGETLLIVTSDHGEGFLEHQSVAHPKTDLSEEVIRVPMLMRGPGLPRGLVIDGVVENLDLTPTILEYAGIPPRFPFQGESLLPRLRGEPDAAPEAFALAEGRSDRLQVQALVMDRWKLIRQEGETRRYRFYDLEQDPGETRDLGTTAPAFARCQARLDALQTANARHQQHPPVPASVDPEQLRETLHQFRALGYLD